MKTVLLVGSSIISKYKNIMIENYNIINNGVSGLMTSQLNINNNDEYDYMIFYCGNNDLKKNINKNEIVSNIEKYIYKFKKQFPNTKIIILSILFSPKNYELNLIDKIRYINNKLKNIDNIYYLNINRQLSNKKYYSDGTHFNYMGYKKLNDILSNIIDE
jgi:lysophospholipase L1-like esterase